MQTFARKNFRALSLSLQLSRNFTVQIPKPNFTPTAHTGMSYEDARNIRNSNINRAIRTFYANPIYFSEGHMQYLYDIEGKQYLDLFGGICTVGVGHSHPLVLERVRKQLEKLQHVSNIYLTEPALEYAERLKAKLPKNLKNFYFTNSGTEANELAFVISQLHSNNNTVYALENCYHGAGPIALNFVSVRTWKPKVAQSINTVHLTSPNYYRQVYGNDLSLKEKTDIAIKTLEQKLQYSNPYPALFITESAYQGVGGVMCTRGDGTYHKRAYEIMRNAGALCLADEVQSGFGRLGTDFWGFQGNDAEPDMVTMAKSIGNGFPLGCLVTTDEIADKLASVNHFNTYSGSPISTSAGLGVLDAIEQDNLQENARVTGGYFKEGLLKLQEKYDVIGDVRGEGFFLGVDLVKDRQTKEPAFEYQAKLHEFCREQGLLYGKGGITGNVIRIQPPMCMTKQDVDFALSVLEHGFQTIPL